MAIYRWDRFQLVGLPVTQSVMIFIEGCQFQFGVYLRSSKTGIEGNITNVAGKSHLIVGNQ